MRTADEEAESQEPLRQCSDVIEYWKSGGEPGSHGNARTRNYKTSAVAFGVAAVVIFGLLMAVTVLAVLLLTRSSDDPVSSAASSPAPPFVPYCLEGWVGYGGKCYYFSEKAKSWDSSQRFCSWFNASLAGIDTLQEKDFVMRYAGLVEHWIGLRRESGQPWKWVNGTQFSQQLFEVRAEGDCAYVSDVFVSSSRCYSVRNWICSKPDAYTKAKENAREGESADHYGDLL